MTTEPAGQDVGGGGTLTVLGCDGSYPGPGGAASGYLVEAQGTSVWLDAGAGTFAMLQLVADVRRLDAVVISHEHPDHCSDLDSLAVWLRHAGLGRALPVYAPAGVRERSYFADDPALTWREIEAGQRLHIESARGGAGLTSTFFRTDHGPTTLAARIEPADGTVDGAALGYSADTGPGWSPEELGRGVGLLLCEASYTRDHEGSGRHLSGRQAASMAAAASVSQLVLTHRWPSVPADALAAESDEAFGRPVHQAAPGRVFAW